MNRQEAAALFADVCIRRTRPDVPTDIAAAMDEVLRLVGGPEFAHRNDPHKGTPLEMQARRNAVDVIIGASELAGAHGLHLTMREVDEMPERVLRALHTLGVTDAEIATINLAE